MRALVLFSALLSFVAAQLISYDSVFCNTFINLYSPEPIKAKYMKMVENLNKVKTLKAQKKRATRFINNNWKELWGAEKRVLADESIIRATNQLESRWRMVHYFRALLAKMKPKLTANEFDEIKALLWETDKVEKQLVVEYYFNWKRAAVNKISTEKRQQEMFEFIYKWEKGDLYAKFEKDQYQWNKPGHCYKGCFE